MKLNNLAKFHAYNLVFKKYMIVADKLHDLTTKQYYLNSLSCGLGRWAKYYIIGKEHMIVEKCTFVELKNFIGYKLEKKCLL